MKNIQYVIVLGAAMLLGAAQANAAHWVNLPEGSFCLKPYETKSIHLDGCNHRVEKISVRAKTDGLHHCDANIEVFTNYDYYHLKGNVEAKGYPTDTTVDIDGNTQTIVLKNNSNVLGHYLKRQYSGVSRERRGRLLLDVLLCRRRMPGRVPPPRRGTRPGRRRKASGWKTRGLCDRP